MSGIQREDDSAGWGVLGAGALGLTVALRLAQRGEPVTVLERERAAGGLAAGFSFPGLPNTYLEKFYHHLFRSDRDAIALIEELGLGARLVWPRPTTACLVHGRAWPLDSARRVLRFGPLSPPERLRLGAAIAYLKLERQHQRLEGRAAAPWIRRTMGRRVYDLVWGPQLVSKFGAYAEQIALSWFWARVHFRSQSLGYVRGGFQHIYAALVREIERHGGRVLLGHEARAIEKRPDGTFRIESRPTAATVPPTDHRFGAVVSTLPTRVTLRLTPQLPAAFARQFAWGQAYGAHCVILALDRPFMPPVYWLSINDPGYPFLAAVEHTNCVDPAEYGGRRLLYLGNYLPMEHPLFTQDDTETVAQFYPSLKQINPDFEPSWVQEHWVWQAPFAQPIVTTDFVQHIPPHETPLPGLYLANMFQVYPQDRGQNYSIRMANRLVARLPRLTGGR